ncbi:TetR family transcriptional regulator [Rhizobium sp. TH2]|uniref:TetR/AcrR family transcriptional regulator n=1 Tax=Rhizobium sp. TH2 TaxID=2775403 RepID=UPI002157A70E|nr:TetR/AcrR family transcriptional regulator [Rhizobium sp. TH2]UVC10666.1 TetR family transcriptional regulator [Rhizobium sp. TH2]
MAQIEKNEVVDANLKVTARQASVARKQPTQQRARERLDKIMSAASELIARTGSDRLKMGELAEHVGISIGSLYQYFPDKAAIIRSLAEHYGLESRACISSALDTVHDVESLKSAYLGLVDQYYELFLSEPVMRDVWSGMQADKQLMAIELAESRLCAAMLADAMKRAFGDIDRAEVEASALLIWQLGESTMRLAISLDRAEGDAMVEAFKRMTMRELLAMQAGS